MTGQPCGHCDGTGQCERICCTVFGNAVRREDKTIRVCMLCRGSGAERRS